MKRQIFLASAILVLLGIAACGPAIPAASEAAPGQAAISSEPFHPLTTRTGVPAIDQILSAISGGDIEALRALVEFTPAVCTLQDGLGGPPKCRAGETEGTPVDVLAFMGGEGSFLRREDLGSWTGVPASGIYAIYQVNAAVLSSEQYYPVGRYVVLLAGEENQPATALRIGESGIVRVDTIFDSSPDALSGMVEREALNVLLAPKSGS